MTHSKTTRKVALLATAALVGTAFAAAPVAAQGDPNVCDGVIDGAPLTLEMTMHTGSNPGAEMATVEAFNAGPGAELGVTINVIPIGEQAYETAITSAAAAGEMPDLVDMDGPTLYPFAFNGLLRPITSCAGEEKLDAFLPSIIEQGTYNGELYSLGSVESGMGLWAHKSLLEDVGARLPDSQVDRAQDRRPAERLVRHGSRPERSRPRRTNPRKSRPRRGHRSSRKIRSPAPGRANSNRKTFRKIGPP